MLGEDRGARPAPGQRAPGGGDLRAPGGPRAPREAAALLSGSRTRAVSLAATDQGLQDAGLTGRRSVRASPREGDRRAVFVRCDGSWRWHTMIGSEPDPPSGWPGTVAGGGHSRRRARRREGRRDGRDHAGWCSNKLPSTLPRASASLSPATPVAEARDDPSQVLAFGRPGAQSPPPPGVHAGVGRQSAPSRRSGHSRRRPRCRPYAWIGARHRCCLSTDAGAARASIARRWTLASRPERAPSAPPRRRLLSWVSDTPIRPRLRYRGSGHELRRGVCPAPRMPAPDGGCGERAGGARELIGRAGQPRVANLRDVPVVGSAAAAEHVQSRQPLAQLGIAGAEVGGIPSSSSSASSSSA
jgi:hypothetical protein